MPPRAFHCPSDPDGWHELKDCLQCRDCCVPGPLLRALWEDMIADQGYHDDPKAISVTQVTGCLRQSYLDKVTEYAATPESFLARWVGTTVHARLQQAAPPGDAEMQYQHDLGDGYTFCGTVDYQDAAQLIDWKFTGFLPTEPRPGHDRQIQIYHKLAKSKAAPEVCYISTKGIASFLLDLKDTDEDLDWALGRAALLKSVLMGELDPKTLPLEGLEIKYGRDKTLCSYCDLKDQCVQLGGKDDA